MSEERRLSLASVSSAASEEDAAWRFLDAVWDVPVGLGLCDAGLRFIRVNEALADFDGLSVASHYDTGDVLARLPAAFADGLRAAASGDAHDVEFTSGSRCVLVKLHPVLRPSDREGIGAGNRDAATLLKRAVEEPDVFHAELHVETDAGRAALLADATALRDVRGNVEEVVVSLHDVTRERRDLDVARSNVDFQQQIIGIV